MGTQKFLSNFSAVKTGNQVYEFGEFRFDTANHQLSSANGPVLLKPKSLDCLLLLLENTRRVLSKDELMELLWPDSFVEEANLTQTIYELRRAIGESGRRPKLIENVPKRGYRFAGEVRTIRTDIGHEVTNIGSLAVLPFCSLRADGRDESLELGLAETLITGLSSLGKIVIRPTSAVRRYTDLSQDPLEAGRDLRVDAVLQGTIQMSTTGRLRVSARLLRVSSGVTIWAGQFDETLDDVFIVQDSLLEKILSALSVKLSGSERTRLQKENQGNPEAHRLFLKCRYHWHKWTVDNWHRSIEYGERAIEIDPGNAAYYAWTAAGYCTLGIFGSLPPAEAFGKARQLVGTALQLDDNLSKAHEVLGAIKLFYEWDWVATPVVLGRAIELDPYNYTVRHLRAFYFLIVEKESDAISEMTAALAMDPISLISNTDLGYIYYFSGHYRQAIEQFERTLALDPYFSHARIGLGYSYLAAGEMDMGLETMRSATELFSAQAADSPALGYAYARIGDQAAAKAVIESLKRRSKKEYVDPFHSAVVYVGLRERKAALDKLNEALKNRSRDLLLIGCDAVFQPLHGTAEFQKILSAVGLPTARL